MSAPDTGPAAANAGSAPMLPPRARGTSLAGRLGSHVSPTVISSLSALIIAFSSTTAIGQAHSEITTHDSTQSMRQTVADTGYGRTPLFFIRNEGQVDKRIHFYERGRGHATLFTDEGLIFNLVRGLEGDRRGDRKSVPGAHTISMSFRHGNADVEVSAGPRSPTRVNLLQGNDPKQWRTGIDTFSEIRYHNIYNGIDGRFFGRDGTLEYDLIIAPGAHPDAIEMRYQGIKALRIAADGSLEIDVGDGLLRQTPPLAYQEVEGQRILIPSAFRLIDHGLGPFVVGFSIAAYDSSRPLVIDPSIVYSTYLGGSLEDIGHGVTADEDEQAYIVGETTSSDLLPVGGFNGGTDVFLAELNRQGDTLLAAATAGERAERAERDRSQTEPENVHELSVLHFHDSVIGPCNTLRTGQTLVASCSCCSRNRSPSSKPCRDRRHRRGRAGRPS